MACFYVPFAPAEEKIVMPKCKRCNQDIEFRPHPISGKLTPFSDGEIHFAICKEKHDGYTSKAEIDEMRCPTCQAKPQYIYWGVIANGKQLRLAFDCYHKGIFLAQTERNIKAVNTTEKEYLNIMIKTNDPYGQFQSRLNSLSQ